MQELLEMWIQSLDWEDPLEEGMASKSSILVWRVPWTDKPDRLLSIGLQRVEHELKCFYMQMINYTANFRGIPYKSFILKLLIPPTYTSS